MFYNTLFAQSGASSAMSQQDAMVADAVFAFEAVLATGDDSEKTISVLDMLDAAEANLAAKPTKESANLALTMMNALTGGAIASQMGVSMENLSGDHIHEAQFGLKEMAANAWDAVVKFIEDMIRKVKVFIGTFFDKMPKLKKRAEALKEKASNTSGTIENSKIKIGGAYSVLATKDKKVEKLAEAIKDIAQFEKQANVANIPSVIGEDSMDKLAGSADEIKSLPPLTAITGFIVNVSLPALSADNMKIIGNVTRAKGKPDLPGNKIFAVSSREDTNLSGVDKSLREIATIKVGFYTQDTKLKLDDSTEVTTLTSTEVEAICEAVIEMADVFAKSKGALEQGYKTQEKLVNIAKKIKANVDKTDYKDVKSTLNAAKGAIQNMSSFAVNPAQQIATYGYSVASAALSYGEKSLAQYK